eukprot:366522-Chlamydomonas_euryale.AAC.1
MLMAHLSKAQARAHVHMSLRGLPSSRGNLYILSHGARDRVTLNAVLEQDHGHSQARSLVAAAVMLQVDTGLKSCQG